MRVWKLILERKEKKKWDHTVCFIVYIQTNTEYLPVFLHSQHASMFVCGPVCVHVWPSSSSAGCVLVRHEVTDTKKAAYSSWSLFGPGWAGWRVPGGLPGCHQQGFISPRGLMRFHQVPRAACNLTYTRACMYACMVCTHDHRKCTPCQASLLRRAE